MAKKSGVLKKHAPKDFEKIKSKVGKKKAAARNETKTDYKVKQLQMPSQNALLVEKGDEVTHRRLGLLDLLAHMQHHSSKVRRDALGGLRELCTTHETVLRSNLARIVDATTIAPIDSHAEVRSAFIDFQSWLLGAVSRTTILAFAPTLALHARSSLSHVSGEVREDGLALLELYLRDLGGAQLFNQSEVSHLIEILCQLTAEMDTVLPCLYQLLGTGLSSSSGGGGVSTMEAASAADGAGDLGVVDTEAQQVPLMAVLQGRFQLPGLGGGGGFRRRARAPAGESQRGGAGGGGDGEAEEDSPVWSFCLRAWMQAGELPFGIVGRGAAAEAAARPGRLRLLAAAALERALCAAVEAPASSTRLRPSASQISALVGVVRRSEWPLQVDTRGTFRALADSINLRMARVFALLASRCDDLAPDAPRHQLARLAGAAASFLEGVSSAIASSAAASAAASSAAAAASPSAGASPAASGGSGPRGRSGGGRGALGGGGGGGGGVIGGGETLQSLMVNGASGIKYVLRTLDMLWACLAAPGDFALLSEEDDMPGLLSATGRLAGDELAEASASSSSSSSAPPPALLAVPLAASLLGLRPCAVAVAGGEGGEGAAGCAPVALRAAWPEALGSLGEPSFAAAVERLAPGTAVGWVKVWPRLLFYLGDSDPAASSLLLSLLLELSKKAAQAGSLYEPIFAAACPLLVPFLTGPPGADISTLPPPLVALPLDAGGPQGLAATLVQRLPRLHEPFVRLLVRMLCRWSAMGAAVPSPSSSSSSSSAAAAAAGGDRKSQRPQQQRSPLLGDHAADLLLSAILERPPPPPKRRRSAASDEALASKLRAAASVLAARRPAEATNEQAFASDRAALRLARTIADWLMSDCAAEVHGLPSPEARKRVVLESVAWPLCLQVLAAAPELGPRCLCFLCFCCARLPAMEAEISGSDGSGGLNGGGCLGHEAFLGEVFDRLVLQGGGAAVRPAVDAGGVLVAAAALPSFPPPGAGGAAASAEDDAAAASSPPAPIGGGLGGLGVGAVEDPGGRAEAQQVLGRLLVAAWMRMAPSAAGDSDSAASAACALLARRCGQRIIDAAAAAEEAEEGPLFASAAVLEEAIGYCTAHGLRASSVSTKGQASFPPEFRDELDRSLRRLEAKALAPPCWAKLRALLPLI